MSAMGEIEAPELPKKVEQPEEIDDAAGEEEPADKVMKIVVVGDGASGKTSICQRFAKETFDKSYHQTLGLDFFSRRVILPGEVQVLVQVWDIGGQSIAGEMIDKYLMGAHIIFLVYDVTNSKSFENAADWMNVIRKNLKDEENPPRIILLGNKTDLEERRTVPVDTHRNFATSNGMVPTYISAKTGDTVYMTFRQAVADVLSIPLSKAETESDIDIVQGTVIETAKHESSSRTRSDQSSSTSVCSIS
ncbi:hypothetical protein L5515_010593 [Caenorhabditis briggsae]|uniref:Protein CBR-RAB-28 n=1 Tax=Caenorhabditis briggsae TaxID=6238 RepID=A0AAE9EQN4_CAEBR|nr:hypothetical protein L5515_010593 [Caenorhabditis briggsae]